MTIAVPTKFDVQLEIGILLTLILRHPDLTSEKHIAEAVSVVFVYLA